MDRPVIFNWSGGKDSALSLYHLRRQGQVDIRYLVTTVSDEFDRIAMHGVRVALLEEQAASLGIALHMIRMPPMPTMEVYDDLMAAACRRFKSEGIDHAVFGDIFLEDLKKYREQRLAEVGMQGIFPIWKRSSVDLVREFIDLGFKAVLVCVDERHLDQSFAGRMIDVQLLKDLPAGVDPCGENGEYHSFVFDGPIFRRPICFKSGERLRRTYAQPKTDTSCCMKDPLPQTGFWYQDLVPCASYL